MGNVLPKEMMDQIKDCSCCGPGNADRYDMNVASPSGGGIPPAVVLQQPNASFDPAKSSMEAGGGAFSFQQGSHNDERNAYDNNNIHNDAYSDHAAQSAAPAAKSEHGGVPSFPLDTILSNIRGCDKEVCEGVFDLYKDQSVDAITLDGVPPVRHFLTTMTALDGSQFDEALMTSLDDNGNMPFSNFYNLCKTYTLEEQEALTAFLNISDNNAEGALPIEDGRTALRTLGEQTLRSLRWKDNDWSKVLDTLLSDVRGTDISMEEFSRLAQDLAAIHRAAAFPKGAK